MKNTKEVTAILTAIHCINYTSEHRDPDILKITDYAFRRLFGSNTNLLMLACVGKSKEQIMPEVMHVLGLETQHPQNDGMFITARNLTPLDGAYTWIWGNYYPDLSEALKDYKRRFRDL